MSKIKTYLSTMQIKSFMLAGAAATIFCAAAFIYPLNAFADKGEEYPNEKCQLNKKDGSFTTGQCSVVCKGLDVGKRDVNTGYRTCNE